MPFIESIDHLTEYRRLVRAKRDPNQLQVLVCGGPGCLPLGSEELVAAFKAEMEAKGIDGKVILKTTGCHGLCSHGVRVLIRPQEIAYQKVQPEDVAEIVDLTLINGGLVERLLYQDPIDGKFCPHKADIPFYQTQNPLVLRKLDAIDPESLDDYLALGGYRTLRKILFQMTPERVIDQVEKSGLRGRGGGGFLTGRKWRLCRQVPGEVKFIICNGDEGDPGAFMDRAVMEGDPHAVIEGLIVGAYAIGALKGYIYVRHEYPLAVKRLTRAVEQARDFGFLGTNILRSKFSFDIKISQGAGAFVCGEETALIASIEGRIGEPMPRPPYPIQAGLFGLPTVINNVETLANIPEIINLGAEHFAALGTEKSKGTKVFSLVGAVNNTGLLEVPMGTSLRHIVYDLGGGIPGNHEFKAVQTGGPSGGCIPKQFLDLPVDYDSLQQVGSIMGSGGMIVMDTKSCMVDVARYFISFLMQESCGKCTPCREGLKQLHAILTDITSGRGEEKHLAMMEDLCRTMASASLCGLGQSAANPVLSTLKYFREEYTKHIVDKKCPALVCRQLLTYTIDPNECTSCLACVRECPVGAISGPKKEPQVINQDLCIKCGLCHDVCQFDAVKVE
ncbi:NADH-quinone oxidoreductase subunit NuoF [Desulfobacca acetoxidans]|uniref:NADH dehydrogenase (Quinone) n=1 Tax=Desulfobacca acetoxidans (strain ATCC 700848 / DSM 11109 / ASRB2) TaxID=880072 RepID=F2NHM1_DESAR|nr:NADH-quinone oxidoreductase subunit NuoF [Desulfobacca acetoxidans]AEB09208.1 NADH dehydrogenase (quinone) [Desulfobacca acetoxidans DSM 11109]HAY22531.1 NADH-quinone oxidoreductase subunit NuoF [Desulfobacterales bacterium]